MSLHLKPKFFISSAESHANTYGRKLGQRLCLCEQKGVVVHHFVPYFMIELSVISKTIFVSVKIAKNVGLSPSTARHIENRFRFSGEISA